MKKLFFKKYRISRFIDDFDVLFDKVDKTESRGGTFLKKSSVQAHPFTIAVRVKPKVKYRFSAKGGTSASMYVILSTIFSGSSTFTYH